MKKRTIMLVMGLSIVMLAGGCSKNSANEGNTDNKVTETADDKDETNTSDTTNGITTVTKEDYKVSDYITLGKYKGVEVTIEKQEVTDQDVDAAIQMELEYNAKEEEITDRKTVEDGDIVNIDYEGFKDGVAFEGGKDEGADLEIGSNSFIPGFEEGLIGATVGEQVDLNLTFPENYHAEDLAGQDVVFKVTVNSIKRLVVPELDENYVKENTEFETVDAYRQNIRESLEKEIEAEKEQEKLQSVIQAIIDGSEIKSYPENILEFYKADFKNYYIQYASYFGMDFANFLATSGVTEEEFEAEALKFAEAMASQELVLNSIIDTEDIELTEEEYQDGLTKMASDYGYPSSEELLAVFTEKQVKEALLWQKAMDLVVAEAIEHS